MKSSASEPGLTVRFMLMFILLKIVFTLKFHSTVVFSVYEDVWVSIMFYTMVYNFGEVADEVGESTSLPPTWPGFVVGSLPCSESFFSENSGFPLSPKINTS